MEFFGVELVGFSAENGRKLLLTAAGIVLLWALGEALVLAVRRLLPRGRAFFWARQGVRLAVAVLVFLAVVSIWFDDPARLATGLGLVTAGLAFALQKVITALAGYFVILRGQTFNVGDRITMGGVRGDVIALSFTQTTIMEMGQPPAVQGADPAQWVRSRQYTGRVVTVSNARVFDEPVYNYTREFPYLWEEMSVPVPYQADHAAAERILLQVAGRHTVQTSELGEGALRDMEERYFVKASDMRPAVFYRLTDNWLELTVRFIAPTHAIRELKDAMTRDILRGLAGAGIRIASTTIEIVGR
ncbi:MAG TPA: mechanosensitive ion channel domain-containing protein [Burkholderiales bacterium]